MRPGAPDSLDRILLDEISIEPTPDFALRVMERLRREARAPAPIAFPWRPFVAAVVAAIAALVLAAMSIDPASLSDSATSIASLGADPASRIVVGLTIAAGGVLTAAAIAWAGVEAALPRAVRAR